MRLVRPGRPHLTYCTNVHAGEDWAALRTILQGPVTEVARAVAGGEPFGVGLRVAARAARELRAPDTREELADVLARANAYVFTINGFPYGAFHGARVKDLAYRPDWREDARLDYTRDLADLLAWLLPENVVGSISTVPGAFGARADTAAAREEIVEHLLAAAAHLVEIERRSGRTIALALEPEPACLLETTRDAATFFREYLFAQHARARFASMVRTDGRSAELLLRRHLGVCLDACHLAVAFESPSDAVATLAAEGIAVPKLQASAGIEIEGAAEAKRTLGAFDDGVYLHQTTVVLPGGRLRRYLDLEHALRDAPEGIWRVHVHVPVNRLPPRPLATTRPVLETLLRLTASTELSPHVEVETYTWSVLPPELRGPSLVADIADELRWVRAMLEEDR